MQEQLELTGTEVEPKPASESGSTEAPGQQQPQRTLMLGGSRSISSLPEPVTERLDEEIGTDTRVLIGDAKGADLALQTYLFRSGHGDVSVFSINRAPRNRLDSRDWQTELLELEVKHLRYHHYSSKDLMMVRRADAGLFLWDRESAGTAVNVVRMVRRGLPVAVFDSVAGSWFEPESEAFYRERCDSRRTRDKIQRRLDKEETVERVLSRSLQASIS